MKRLGIISYNIFCNFTNYGSALQTYALSKTIDSLIPGELESVVIKYRADTLRDKDPRNPFAGCWDQDEDSIRLLRATMPAILVNADKFDEFYSTKMRVSDGKYNSDNLGQSFTAERLDGYVCGSDTIFCIPEFGFDDGYYANIHQMRGKSISYAASFGDSVFSKDSTEKLKRMLSNFHALGIREHNMIPFISENLDIPVSFTIDPTLLLEKADYEDIMSPRQHHRPYLLLYSRRYNPDMETFARKTAEENGWDIVEISLRADNKNKGHIMRYDAGVEEFLSLQCNAEMVVTNSFHGLIFAVQMERPFYVFSREQANSKIKELMNLFGIEGRLLSNGYYNPDIYPIDYTEVKERIRHAKESSIRFLRQSVEDLLKA